MKVCLCRLKPTGKKGFFNVETTFFIWSAVCSQNFPAQLNTSGPGRFLIILGTYNSKSQEKKLHCGFRVNFHWILTEWRISHNQPTLLLGLKNYISKTWNMHTTHSILRSSHYILPHFCNQGKKLTINQCEILINRLRSFRC